ncbi:hypothetical protein A2686_04775 [Candidatus Woesebacteria bacterium RIFCSPHIGHO2_01_FULL_38_10]|uniref:HTH marR-type domain-containing protein n=1 Tax=Candidatus Woesebacteria bacterium RIFCSPLOWO2_01_FULL_39_10b TaxID=1802517 RepID=A0A1F8B624_9BACT|nr:MAG: hypothetical protein A2686_04775 [Candidatus Woesebacteria bacterium RIFCSPHIGHO2_01_FULL_38_10]OGM59447.1 MAG: hypothetical protein A2892_02255 [Candidatus Woesebacteria bacterium RIFCSPLOWO2_01_FULL_39_10b]
MDSFFINPLAIVFLPQIDKKNNYKTIACDWQKEEFVKVNSAAYKILYTIKENSGITISKLARLLQKDELRLGKFLGEMEKKNIVSK